VSRRSASAVTTAWWGGALSLLAWSVAVLHAHPWFGGWSAVLWLMPWFLLGAVRPVVSMAVLLACLPLAHAGLWTGWRQVDEFELLVAASAAGWCLARWWQRPWGATAPEARHSGHPAAWALLCAWALWGVFQGGRHVDAAVLLPWHEGWRWADHEGGVAPWRALRGSVWPLLALWLLAPWLVRAHTLSCWRMAMCVGLCGVSLTVAWERHLMVGVWDMATQYRTAGPFWDMSLGGGAIDAYLAMALPWAWWSLWLARSKAAWCLWAALVALGIYTVVTTFSRGVLIASAVGVLWLHGLAVWPVWRQVSPRRRLMHGWVTGALVIWWLALVVSASFAVSRLEQSAADAVGRWRHWGQQLSLMTSASQWMTGLGLAQVPAAYSASTTLAEMAGRAQWVPPSSSYPAHLLLRGPPTRADLGGAFGLTQSVSWASGGPDRFELTARSTRGLTLRISRCDQWLFHPMQCESLDVNWPASPEAATRSWGWPASADGFSGTWGRTWGPQLVTLSVVSPGADAQVFAVHWSQAGKAMGGHNWQFAEGLSGWWPVATRHFVPWHSDNLYLEVGLERGVIGLLIFGGMLLWALRSGAALPWAGLHASVVGVALLGLLISAHEFPRVAFLLHFLLGWTLLLGSARGKGSA
jgi:hypothetical protein